MRLLARAFATMAVATLLLAPGRAGAQTTVPSAPLNLAASITNDVLLVTWDAPATGAPILATCCRWAGEGLGSGVAIPTTAPSFTLAHARRLRSHPHFFGECGEHRGPGTGQRHRRRWRRARRWCRARR